MQEKIRDLTGQSKCNANIIGAAIIGYAMGVDIVAFSVDILSLKINRKQ